MPLTPRRRNRSGGAESAPAGQLFVLRLYAGVASPNSLQAPTTIRKICDRLLNGRCQPPPLRRSFGPLSDRWQRLAAFSQIASSVHPAGDPANEG